MRCNVNDAQLLSPVMTCATEGAIMCSREKVCCARSRKCLLCTLLGIVSTLLLAIDSFTVSDFQSFPSSSRSSMIFLPAVGFALVCLLLAMLMSCLLLAMLFRFF